MAAWAVEGGVAQATQAQAPITQVNAAGSTPEIAPPYTSGSEMLYIRVTVTVLGDRGGSSGQGGKKQDAQHDDLRETVALLVLQFLEDLLCNGQADDKGRDGRHKGTDDQGSQKQQPQKQPGVLLRPGPGDEPDRAALEEAGLAQGIGHHGAEKHKGSDPAPHRARQAAGIRVQRGQDQRDDAQDTGPGDRNEHPQQDRADENTGHLHPQRGQPKDGGQKLTSKHKQDADDSRDRFFRTHDLLTFLLI